MITGTTKVCGIIGDPVEHSLSPIMHNAAFDKLGIDCIYVTFRVPSDHLEEATKGLRSVGILGFNVTVPHKTRILKYLDRLDELAKRIGAVNTVLNKRGSLVGYNTDATGALKALEENQVRTSKCGFTILGAGGAARAIVFALAKTSHKITVLNRTYEKARRLELDIKRELGVDIEASRLSRKILSDVLPLTDVLVNATTVGMKGSSGTLIDKADLRRKPTVFDIVYRRSETDLLRKARLCGCKTIGGIEMLLHQGAAAFEIWTGRKAPLKTMRSALYASMRVT
ncbi:MAG: shikimate dehydrogenase [archaeon]